MKFLILEISDSLIAKKQPYKRIHKQGYWVLMPKVNKKPHSVKLHRLVAEVWLEPPTQELIDICKQYKYPSVHVNHKDGDKTNNLPSNLEWCTNAQNVKHTWENGLSTGAKGEENGRATITEDLVHQMCVEFEKGMTPKEAVEYFGVSRQQASKIRAGIQWKHVVCKYNIPKLKNRSKKSND